MNPTPLGLNALLPELSGPMLLAARHILAHPEDVAVFSMRELARRIGVPPVTLVRLAQRLGLPGYSALRRPHVEAVRRDSGRQAASRNSTTALAIAEAAQGNAGASFAQRFFAEEQGLLGRTAAGLDEAALAEAARLLAESRRVFIAGRRTAYGVALALGYGLAKMRPDVRLLDSAVGAPETPLEDAGPGDLLVAITFSPVNRHTCALAEQAAAAGALVIGITDTRLGPLPRLAGPRLLLVPIDGPGFLDATGGAIALARLLVALTLTRLGGPARERVRRNEERVVESGEFVLGRPRRGRSGSA
ncbi:MAG: MurR/RpiR family transcriptional regulator [Roseococcus sp.]